MDEHMDENRHENLEEHTGEETRPKNQEIAEHVSRDCARAPLNPRWIFKLGVIALVVFVVGVWGYMDAAVWYPARGERYASWAQWQYLDQAKKANAEDFGIFVRQASVTNPREELARLQEPETQAKNRNDAANATSGRSLRASMFVARQNWLEALKVIGRLDEEHTTMDSPQRRLDELSTEWQSAQSVPKPLHNFDLIVQWLIMGVCWLTALFMLVHMLRVRARKYAWDASAMTLTLPGGAAIGPDDLEEVDKRKWDKFIVFLRIRDAHPALGGQEVAVDTYQHKYVEDWILAMEERAFGSQELHDAPDRIDTADGDGQSPADADTRG